MNLTLFITAVAFIYYVHSDINSTLEESKNSVLFCLEKLENFIDSRTFVIISSLQISIPHLFKNKTLVLYKEENLTSVIDISNYNMFVIILNEVSQFRRVLQNLSMMSFWTPKRKFLIAYLGKGDVSDLFNISLSYSLININIINENENNVYIYSTQLYNSKHCGIYTTYKMVASCHEDIRTLFLDETPKDLQGCEVRVMAYNIQPYVMKYDDHRDVPATAGIEVTLLHTLAQRMNFTANYISNPYSHWGYKFRDGRYSMMFQELINGQVDMILGFTYGNSSYSYDLDASYPHLSDSSVWYFPSAVPVAQWKSLTLIFERKLWILIFLMVLINGAASWILMKRGKPDFVESLMLSLYTLLQGSIKCPNVWKARLVFALWLVTCLLLFTAHQCQLVSILTNPLYEKQMSTLEELIQSGSEFGFYPTIKDAYTVKNTSTNLAILQRFQTCPLTVECLNRTAFRRDFAVVKNRRQVEFLMPRYYTFPNGRTMLYDTRIAAFTTRIMFYTRKALPFLPRLNKLAMLLASNGLMAKWDADIKFYIIQVEDEDQNEPLSLIHLQGAFLVYGLGVLLGLIAFIAELLLKYVLSCRLYKRSINQKN